jgi:2-desacetyl-2-hydroxyethyl bacteriochlorophyllide A dehydrogenase
VDNFSSNTMKTLLLNEPRSFALIDRPLPADVPPGHALVRVARVGICGTDWHAYNGKQPFFNYPRVLGHELGVVVESVNDTSSELKPGDQCSVEPYLNCGNCIACRRGKSNCCASLRVLGVHTDGGMTERIVVPTRKLHRSSKLTLDQLALVETLGIGCHAVSRATVEPGENVLVIGAGPIGLSVVPFVQAAGANVIMADVSDDRLAAARKLLNISTTINASQDLLDQLKAATSNDLPTAVIDATGNPASMASTFDLVAPGGRIVFVGLFQGEVTFNDPNFHRREITLMGSRNALPGDFTKIIQLIEDGKVDTTPWITHRSSIDGFLDVLPDWLKPEAKVLKAMIEF